VDAAEGGRRRPGGAGHDRPQGGLRLDGLEPVEYRLRVEPPPSFPIPEEAAARIAAHLRGAGAGGKRLLLEFQTVDDRYRAALDETVGSPPGLLLRLDLDGEAAEGCLARFELADGAGHILASGFVGLRPGLRGRLSGEVRLDLLGGASERPARGDVPQGLRLNLRPTPLGSLHPYDRLEFERSLRATEDPRSREALEALIKKLAAGS
jgi:hypothetical protein